FQVDLVSQRVHRLPEAGMPICGELPGTRQALHRLALPGREVVLDVVDDGGLENEEAGVNPCAVAVRLLLESANEVLVALQRESPEPAGRLAGRQRDERATLAMEADETCQIDVCDAI